MRERIALWDGAKGALLEEIMGERDVIADSDQGKSFRAFWDFLMSSNDELDQKNSQIICSEQTRNSLRNKEDELKQNIANNGGNRIQQLTLEIAAKQQECDAKKGKAKRYVELLNMVGEQPALDEANFLIRHKRIPVDIECTNQETTELQNKITEFSFELRQGMQEHDFLKTEIMSLKARRNNIPVEQIAMRSTLCAALGLSETSMPFAGELLQLHEEERDWEGAAERILRPFGLSLLVPDAFYNEVTQWVDKTHLKGRLVYFRLRQHATKSVEAFNLQKDSLARKIAIKPDSEFYDWLERELAHRFDVACCTTQEQFRREVRAMTLQGQIKMPGERHEKDDRHRLADRSRYVLGWSNTEKIATL